MDSLKVGKVIFSLLNGNSDLTAFVNNKIYPIIVEKETTFPFIVYKRSNVIPDYTKDFHFKDNVIIDIICVSTNYAESIEIAGIVRNILEDKRYDDIQSIKLESADEDYTDDAYVQTLSFNLTINK
ncbi:tail completion protein gp17 [Parabacteroides goldsteinii]|uniref:tail completion protein gp17 n=1 Tax=Parabacteroides goldsteinii TaxID=328812 RepID=UPI0032B304F0